LEIIAPFWCQIRGTIFAKNDFFLLTLIRKMDFWPEIGIKIRKNRLKKSIFSKNTVKRKGKRFLPKKTSKKTKKNLKKFKMVGKN